MAFDRRVVLALRNPANPGEPLGPPWLQEAARDVTSLGSIVVVTIMTLAVVGYLLLSRERAEALWMAVAVFGGMALNDALKLAFARPRPDSVFHAARVFTASFPSGHASLSAIAYLTIGALLARSQPSGIVRLNSILPAGAPARDGVLLFLLRNRRHARRDSTPKMTYTHLP